MPIEEILQRVPVLVVSAHPDDETIGAGGMLGRMCNPFVLHVTDGAPRNLEFARAAGFQTREEYARARRRELSCALRLAGIPESRTAVLPITDQRASYDMVGLTRRLRQFLRELKPALILTHAYEGGHPDHDATAFAVHAACEGMQSPPPIYEFTSYHASSPSQPELESGRFLVGQNSGIVVVLAETDRARKNAMLSCFESQADMLSHFQSDEERFREAPAYDFARPPHPGRLYYETFPSGMSAELWLSLAADALRQLGVPALS
jgi:LmbE family N-acetylglucosaminyl deacetylase